MEGPLYLVEGPLYLVEGPLYLVQGPLYLVEGPFYLVEGPLYLVQGPLYLVKGPLYLVEGPFYLVEGSLSTVERQLHLVECSKPCDVIYVLLYIFIVQLPPIFSSSSNPNCNAAICWNATVPSSYLQFIITCVCVLSTVVRKLEIYQTLL